MALIQTSLIWVAYAIAIAILLAISAVFVYIYQKPRERASSVTIVCIVTISALLATILLLPVDVALVSSTVSSKTGLRKDWATQDRVDNLVFALKAVYYSLYSLDALLCLLVIPFTYFFYEEYDEVEAQDGTQTLSSRLLGAAKYTIAFLLLCVILFLVGFFVPAASHEKNKDRNLDYFKDLLAENRGDRALTFGLGLLMTLGTLVYVLYTASGFALLPVTLIRSAPAISVPKLASTTQSELDQNRERQHQLEARNAGRQDGLEPRDRRELDALLEEERVLVRRERLAAESSGDGQHSLMRAWSKVRAFFRPIKLLGGILLLVVAFIVWISMFITSVDKAKNSICKEHCGYLLGAINIFQPMNYFFVVSAKVFPIDYVLFLLLVLFFFSSSVIGIATVGIRFLWIVLFKIRKGRTSPQALLIATVLIAIMTLAINYAIAMIVAPQYTMYGPQTYCDRDLALENGSNCSGREDLIKPCSERASSPRASETCTPSVVSIFLNRITINFPVFGAICFWAQFAFLAVFLVTSVTTLVRAPKLDTDELDEDLEEDEEEGLLSTTGRRLNAAWQDVTGRAQRNNPAPGDYGSTGRS